MAAAVTPTPVVPLEDAIHTTWRRLNDRPSGYHELEASSNERALSGSAYHQLELLGYASGSFTPCDLAVAPGVRVADAKQRVSDKARVSRGRTLYNTYGNEIDALLYHAGVTIGEGAVTLFEEEILRYKPGSFFCAHTDRQRRVGHVGTLLIVAPSSDARGGRLTVHGQGLGDGDEESDAAPFIAFIPLGVPHEVSMLQHGSRIVGKAAVAGVAKRSTPDEWEAHVDGYPMD
jgi:hypothetical protein